MGSQEICKIQGCGSGLSLDPDPTLAKKSVSDSKFEQKKLDNDPTLHINPDSIVAKSRIRLNKLTFNLISKNENSLKKSIIL